MQAEELLGADFAVDRSRESDYALAVIGDLTARIDTAVYEAARARGRQPGESALMFELRCIDEAAPCSKS